MREEGVNRIEVHAAGICVDKDKVLIVKRSSSRRLCPNLWECGGGQVNPGENFEDAVVRQLREELGVIVEPLRVVNTYEIDTGDDSEKIPGIRFVCKLVGYVNGSGPEISEEHSEFKWIGVDEVEGFDFVPGLKGDIKSLS